MRRPPEPLVDDDGKPVFRSGYVDDHGTYLEIHITGEGTFRRIGDRSLLDWLSKVLEDGDRLNGEILTSRVLESLGFRKHRF